MNKKIVKVMVFYEDGTFTELANGTGTMFPTFPPAPAPIPSGLPVDWWSTKQFPGIQTVPYTVPAPQPGNQKDTWTYTAPCRYETDTKFTLASNVTWPQPVDKS